jgi:hypothetical protein
MLPDHVRDCKPVGHDRRDNASMRKSAKRLVGAGVLAAAAYAVWRAFDARRTASNVTWEPQPFPYPPVPRATTADATSDAPSDATSDAGPEPAQAGWVAPVDGSCPATHPVKGKLASGIFHVPGGANYDRTRPDRCYADAGAAEADGLRASKA